MFIWRHQKVYASTIEMKQLLETSISFKFKQEITTQTGNGGTKDIEIMVPLKCPSDFWRTLEMPLINCKISLQWKFSKKCILFAGAEANLVQEFQ